MLSLETIYAIAPSYLDNLPRSVYLLIKINLLTKLCKKLGARSHVLPSLK